MLTTTVQKLACIQSLHMHLAGKTPLLEVFLLHYIQNDDEQKLHKWKLLMHLHSVKIGIVEDGYLTLFDLPIQ